MSEENTGSIVLPPAPKSWPYGVEAAAKMAKLLVDADGRNQLRRFFTELEGTPGLTIEAQENGMVKLARAEGEEVLMLKPEAPLNTFLAWTILKFLVPGKIHNDIKDGMSQADLVKLLTGEA